MKIKSELTASLENYLKAIYLIVKENKAARVKDVSKFLSIGASSVSEALKILSDREYINYQPYGIITLTQKGEDTAVELNKRHEIICNFLENVLLVDKKSIEENAKQFEYGVSEDVLEKFVRFLTFMQTCSCKEPKWIKSFKYYAQNGVVQDKCNACIKKCAENDGILDNSNCCGIGNNL
jgi:DtxR family Mn-dependent transcriptional regulator